MVRTRATGSPNGLATGSTLRADTNTSGAGSSRDIVPKTPQNGDRDMDYADNGGTDPPPGGDARPRGNVQPQVNVQPHGNGLPTAGAVDTGDRMDIDGKRTVMEIDGERIVDFTDTPEGHAVPQSKAQATSPGSDSDEAINARIAKLRKEKKKARRRAELQRVEQKAARGYVDEEDPNSEFFTQRLTLKRAKKVRDPDVYSGESQRALDDCLNQVALVFRTKPLTYASETDKCLYAANYLGGFPAREWEAEEKRIREDPNRTYAYDEFKAFLKERKLPGHVRTANLILKIGYLQQRPTQTVPELIAYLNALESQMVPEYKDRKRRDHLFTSMHEYIRSSIIQQGRTWETRAELEQVATSLETVLTPPDGVKVKKGYVASTKKASHIEDAAKSTARTKVVGSTRRKRKSETRSAPPARAKDAKPATASGDKADLSKYKCFNCNKMGHLSRDCPRSDKKKNRKNRHSDGQTRVSRG